MGQNAQYTVSSPSLITKIKEAFKEIYNQDKFAKIYMYEMNKMWQTTRDTVMDI